ncbi:unnamed protein product [Aphanomyces euteiches]
MDADEFVQLCHQVIYDMDDTCANMAHELSVQRDPTDNLAAVHEVATSGVLASTLTISGGLGADGDVGDMQDRLVTEYLPHFVQVLLARHFDPEFAPVVNEFFQFALACTIQRFRDGDPSLIPTMHRIFDQHRVFYQSRRMSSDDDAANAAFSIYATAHSPLVPLDVIKHINYFGRHGGFHSLLCNIDTTLILALSNDDENNASQNDQGDVQHVPEAFSFDALVCALRALAMGSDHWTNEFAKTFMDDLATAISRYIRLLEPTDIAQLSREAIYELVDVFQMLAAQLDEHRVVLLNQLRLELGRQCFLVKTLEKRMNGLVDMNEALKVLATAPATTTWSPRQAIDWLDDNAILADLLGETMHPELVKRGGPIFDFYARWGMLQPAHLASLWAICTDTRRHEAIVAAAQELFLDVVSHLVEASPLIDHVFELLATARLDVSSCAALKALAASGHAARVVPWLWHAIKTRTDVSNHEAALACMEEMVMRDGALFTQVLVDCVNIIRQLGSVVANSATAALQFLSRLSRLLSEGHDVALLLQDKHVVDGSFLADLIAEFAEYKQRAPELPPQDHLEQVKCRLLALHGTWILACRGDDETLFAIHLSTLWNFCITRAFSPDEASLCFQWIRLCENVLPKMQQRLLTLDLQRHLLRHFATLEGRLITPDAVESFQLLFNKINTANGGLSPSSDGRTLDVILIEALEGLPQLWHLAVAAEDTNVAEDLISSLVGHYLDAGAAAKQKFADTCIGLVLDAKAKVDKSASPSATHTVNRCLDLLRYFLEACHETTSEAAQLTVLPSPMKHPTATTGQHQLSPSKLAKRINLSWPPQLSPTHGPDLRLSDVADVMSEFQPSPRSDGEKTEDDSRTASLQRIVRPALVHPISTETLHCALNQTMPPSPVSVLPEVSTIQDKVVNHALLFDAVFAMLDWSGETSERAWELLCHLPSNRTLLQLMVVLRDTVTSVVPWNTLLDASNIHRLLYGLRLVESLLLPLRDVKAAQTEAHRQWRERFVRLGGSRHLYDILLEWATPDDLSPFSSNLHCACLALLVDTLVYFVEFPTDLPTSSSPFDATLVSTSLPDFYRHLSSSQLIDTTKALVKRHLQSLRVSNEATAAVLAAVRLFFAMAAKQPELLDQWTDGETREWIMDLAVRHPSSTTRTTLCNYLLTFVTPRPTLRATAARLASLVMVETNAVSVELIDFVAALVASGLSPVLKLWMQEDGVVTRLVACLSSTHCDEALLVSYLRLIRCLHTADAVDGGAAASVVEYLLDSVLFGHDAVGGNDDRGGCKELAVRTLAQELLLVIATPSLWQSLIAPRVESFHTRLSTILDTIGRPWNFNPSEEARTSEAPFAGLVNPGCICYMNALLQQLFQLPAFRGHILGADIDANKSHDANEISELQRVFVSLDHTNRKWHDPTTFCVSHRDVDGQQTDLRVQMDADEFLGVLLDRVETVVKPTSLADLGFGGQLVNQIITETGHVSERDEPFVVLSVDVQNKGQLEASLESYVQGETLEGDNAYYCEQARQKVRATKRVCIKKLPHTLVIHLKRFEFDYDTMEKFKLHDLLEFPTQLDMAPYTAGALGSSENQDEAWYALKGVVVHSGSADMGHYYSFIQDRRTSETWWEFNDQIVRPFAADQLAEEGFGGDEEVEKWDAVNRKYVPVVQTKKRSAYMLIYDRIGDALPPSPPPSTVALAVQASVKEDNRCFDQLVLALDCHHVNFLHALLTAAPANNIHLLHTLLQGIIDVGTLLPALPYALALPTLEDHAKLAKIAPWFLRQALSESMADETAPIVIGNYAHRRTWLFDAVHLCQDAAVRRFFWEVATASLRQVLVKEDSVVAKAFLEQVIALFYQREPIEVSGGASAVVANAALGAALQPVAQFLESIAGDAVIARLLVEDCHVMHYFATSFAVEDCPDQFIQPTARTATFPAEQRALINVLQPHIRIPSRDSHSFLSRLAVILSCGFDSLVVEMVIMLMRDNAEMSLTAIKTLLDVLDQVKTTHLDAMLDLFRKVLEIADAHQSLRVSALLSPDSGLLEVADYFKHHRTMHQYTYCLLEFCVTSDSPSVVDYLNEVKDQVAWVRPWIWSYLRSDVPVGDLKTPQVGGDDEDDDTRTVLELTEQFFGPQPDTDGPNQDDEDVTAVEKLIASCDDVQNPAEVES